jgi:hypothetical protein
MIVVLMYSIVFCLLALQFDIFFLPLIANCVFTVHSNNHGMTICHAKF